MFQRRASHASSSRPSKRQDRDGQVQGWDVAQWLEERPDRQESQAGYCYRPERGRNEQEKEVQSMKTQLRKFGALWGVFAGGRTTVYHFVTWEAARKEALRTIPEFQLVIEQLYPYLYGEPK